MPAGLRDSESLLAAVPEAPAAPEPPRSQAPVIHGIDGANTVAEGAGAADGSPARSSTASSPMSPGDPVVQTLSRQDPEATAWHAHQQRKLLMKEKKKNKVGAGNFLSNVVEISEDVNFRFSFTVVAPKAAQLIEAVCNSNIAKEVGGGDATGPLTSVAKKASKDAMYRCMCEVNGAISSATSKPQKAVAKLAFHARSFDEDPPPCNTRQDALNNAIVYALDIAAISEDGEPLFSDQLLQYQRALARLRASTRSKLRPVKALLLYSSTVEGAEPKSGLESWALQLADFEQETGDTWKFGPVCLQDDDALHQIFAEMTSTRLAHTQHDDGVEDLGGEEDEPVFTPSAGEYRPERQRMPMYHSSSSSCSEQERPPCFDAEMSGSECSESALELHARTFGLNMEDLQAGKVGEDGGIEDDIDEERTKEAAKGALRSATEKAVKRIVG